MTGRLALIIEDNADQADIIALALRSIGFDTEIISSGDQALQRLETVVPDLVMLDLNLPEVSGTGILCHIRSEPRLREVRVIIATVEPHLASMLQEKADAVLAKPVDFVEMCDIVAALCPNDG